MITNIKENSLWRSHSNSLKWTYTVRQRQIIVVKKLLNRDFCLICVCVGGGVAGLEGELVPSEYQGL